MDQCGRALELLKGGPTKPQPCPREGCKYGEMVFAHTEISKSFMAPFDCVAERERRLKIFGGNVK